jgi:hypothetical protein
VGSVYPQYNIAFLIIFCIVAAEGRLNDLLTQFADRRCIERKGEGGQEDSRKRVGTVDSAESATEPSVTVMSAATNPFAGTHKFIRRINSTLSAISNYVKDRKDSRAGLNAFAQFSLASLVAIIKKNAVDAGAVKSASSAKPSSFYDAGSDAIISGLNDKIQTLSLNWERRRMEEKQREQDALEEGEGGGGRARAKLAADNSTKIGHFYYTSTLAEGEAKPLPSQLGSLTEYPATVLTKWLAMRAKSRLSRKSERTARIERMQKLEVSFQEARLTCEQAVSIMALVEQDDERQHAMFTLVSRLTDVVEAEEFKLWELIEVSSEVEKKGRLVVSALACEALAEQHCKDILELLEVCDKHRKVGKNIMTKIPKGFGTPAWKDSDLGVAPSKARVNELKQDVQTLRQLVGEVRVHVETGAGHVTGAVQEQTEAANYTQELKKLVGKSQSAAKMKGALTAGKPEYLVHMKLMVGLLPFGVVCFCLSLSIECHDGHGEGAYSECAGCGRDRGGIHFTQEGIFRARGRVGKCSVMSCQ